MKKSVVSFLSHVKDNCPCSICAGFLLEAHGFGEVRLSKEELQEARSRRDNGSWHLLPSKEEEKVHFP